MGLLFLPFQQDCFAFGCLLIFSFFYLLFFHFSVLSSAKLIVFARLEQGFLLMINGHSVAAR